MLSAKQRPGPRHKRVKPSSRSSQSHTTRSYGQSLSHISHAITPNRRSSSKRSSLADHPLIQRNRLLYDTSTDQDQQSSSQTRNTVTNNLNTSEQNDMHLTPFTPYSTFQWKSITNVHAHLPEYTVVSIDGPDATKVLQSITTQDITAFAVDAYVKHKQYEHEIQQDAASHQQSIIPALSTFTSFLTNKGRTMYSAVVSISRQPSVIDETLIDQVTHQKGSPIKTSNLERASKIDAGYDLILPKSHAKQFISHVKENTLRLKSQLIIHKTKHIHSVLTSLPVESQSTPIDDKFDMPFTITSPPVDTPIHTLRDPRPVPPSLMHHYIISPSPSLTITQKNSSHTPQDTTGDDHGESLANNTYLNVSSAIHDVFSTIQGYADIGRGVQQGRTLPLEANYDHLNGIQFQKGCYMGQELTARTHYRGQIRKRILPFFIQPLHESHIDSLPEHVQESFHLANLKLSSLRPPKPHTTSGSGDESDHGEKHLEGEGTGDEQSHGGDNDHASRQKMLHEQQKGLFGDDNEMTDDGDDNQGDDDDDESMFTIREDHNEPFNYSFFDVEYRYKQQQSDNRLPPHDSPLRPLIESLMAQSHPSQPSTQTTTNNPTASSPTDIDASPHYPRIDDIITMNKKPGVPTEIGRIVHLPSHGNVGLAMLRTADLLTPSSPLYVMRESPAEDQSGSQEGGKDTNVATGRQEPHIVKSRSGGLYQIVPICPDYLYEQLCPPPGEPQQH